MKIVNMTDQYWPTISGVSVSIDAFRHELIKKGNTVVIFAPDHPGAFELDKKMKTADIYRFPSHTISFAQGNRIINASEKKNIVKKLDEIKPDIIHIQTEFTMGYIGIEYAHKRKIPLVISAHTNWEDLIALYVPYIPQRFAKIYARFRLKRFFNNADMVVVPTSLMDTLLHLYYVTKPTRVIPTGIKWDPSKKVPNKSVLKKSSPVLKEFPALKNRKILFFAGRIGKEKNIEFLIELFEMLKNTFPDLVLVITGDGPGKTDLVSLVQSKKLSDRILFTGFIEQSRIHEFYALADIFVFASKVESQGLVVLEAMRCGTPVVAIGKMGTREVMGGDNGGFMVDDDIELFAEKVSLLLKNKKLYAEKSKEALVHAEKWRIENMADRLEIMYKRMIHKKR